MSKSLLTTLGLSAALVAGCASDQRGYYSSQTNALGIHSQKAEFTPQTYEVPFILINNRKYHAIDLPTGKNPKVEGDFVLKNNTIRNYMLVPQDSHSEEINGGKVKLSSLDEMYVLANIKQDENRTIINQDATPALISALVGTSEDDLPTSKNIATKYDSTNATGRITTRSKPVSLLEAKIGSDTPFLSIPCETSAIPGSLQQIFVYTPLDKNSVKQRAVYIQDKVNKTTHITGPAYTPVRVLEWIDVPSEKPAEDPELRVLKIEALDK